MHEKTEYDFKETPLVEVLAYFSDRHGITIKFEHAAKAAGFDPNTPVTAKLKDVKLNEALAHILKNLRLIHVVRRDVVLVTMRERTTPDEIKRRDEPPAPGAKEAVREKIHGPEKQVKNLPPQTQIDGRIRALSEQSECEFTHTLLEDVVDFLSSRHNVRIRLDPEAWKDGRPDPPIEVTMYARGTLGAVLDELVKTEKLMYVVDNGGIVITKPELILADELKEMRELKANGLKKDGANRGGALLDRLPAAVAQQPVRAKNPRPFKLDNAEMARVLTSASESEFADTSLLHVVDFLSAKHNVRVQLDSEAWKDGQPDPPILVTMNSSGTLVAVLDDLVKPLKLIYVVRDGGIEITKPELVLAEELKTLRELKAKAAEDGDDPQLVAIEQQYLQQFRRLTKAEISFVVAVCKPTKEQYQQLQRAGEKTTKSAVKAYADVQKKMMQGNRGNVTYPDPRKLIQTGITRAIVEHLKPEQAERYRAETEKRQAHVKQVAVENLVARLDEELVLTAEQRGKLVESLAKHWQAEWGQSLEMFMYGNQFFPAIPDAVVLPALNETQKQVWHGKPKQQNVFFGGFGFGGFIVDDAGDPFMEIEGQLVEPANDDPLEKESK